MALRITIPRIVVASLCPGSQDRTTSREVVVLRRVTGLIMWRSCFFSHSLPPRGFEPGRSSPRALVMAAFFNKSLVWKELSGFTKPVLARASQECVHKGDASPAGDVDPPTLKSITPRLPRHSLNILCHHYHHQSRVPPELKTLFAPSPLEKVLVIGGQRLLMTTRPQH